jgi:hypothetical protein
VTDEEISAFRALIEKPLEGRIVLNNEKMPEEITLGFSKIAEMDHYAFNVGIDTESLSYKYYNSLSLF